ncbi:MAG: hypothetical protein OEZ34_11240 [Spirochaetia bacterium]|nr:hypothetical protein [Spirochaetia bacterium]
MDHSILNTKENIKNATVTRTAQIWLDEKEGIVMAIYTPGAEETLEDAESNVAVVEKLGMGKKRPIFIKGPHKSMTRDARIYYTEKAPSFLNATAIISNSAFVKILGTFLVTLNKAINHDKFPIQFFSSEEEAIRWLRTFVN